MDKKNPSLKKKIRCKESFFETPDQIRALIKALSEPTKTLVETFLFAAKLFSEVGRLYCWEELFKLSASDVFEIEGLPPQIAFERCDLFEDPDRAPTGHLKENCFFSYIPKNLKKRLLKLSRKNKGGPLFVINGKPFTDVSLGRELKKTGLDIIPLQLRIHPEKKLTLLPIFPKRLSEAQIQKLERDVLKTKVRRPRDVPLSDILEEILYREVNGYWSGAPYVEAAKAQKVRWKDKLTQILNHIEKNCWEEPCREDPWIVTSQKAQICFFRILFVGFCLILPHKISESSGLWSVLK